LQKKTLFEGIESKIICIKPPYCPAPVLVPQQYHHEYKVPNHSLKLLSETEISNRPASSDKLRGQWMLAPDNKKEIIVRVFIPQTKKEAITVEVDSNSNQIEVYARCPILGSKEYRTKNCCYVAKFQDDIQFYHKDPDTILEEAELKHGIFSFRLERDEE